MAVDVLKLAADLVVAYLCSEVVERLCRAETAVAPVVVVRAQSVISPSLYVERCQVLSHVVSQSEQSLGQLQVHDFPGTRSLRRQPDQTTHDRVNAAFLDQSERGEEGAM